MKFQFLVLAAGKGKRMGAELPKTLLPVAGKPILQHLIESIRASNVDGEPIIVIGHEGTKLCEYFGETCRYVVQQEQLGTGHAVLVSREAVGDAEAVIVLYGDHPFISTESLRSLAEKHEQTGSVITMMTTVIPTFEGWYKIFHHWGRILRDTHDHIIGIREYKDAMESEQDIREVNPALYCFNAKWLWENIVQLKNFNAQKEFYLTDLAELAVAQGHDICSLTIRPEESIGINTKEELAFADEVYKKLHA